MSAECIAFGERFVEKTEHFMTRFQGPKTLVHGDFRSENILFSDTEATTVDWQTVGESSALTDAAYFLGGSVATEEGCLSVPGVYEPVDRAEWIRFSSLDRDGRPYEREAEGLLAVCVQHEIDHLDGRLFVDYLSQLKRQRIRKKLEKQQRLAS